MPGGWAGSARHDTLPANWAALRSQVKQRAKGQCERIKGSTGRRCPNPGRDCDHIIRPADGGTDELSNLQWLCIYHHRKKTVKESHTARRINLAKAKRKPVKHPGLR